MEEKWLEDLPRLPLGRQSRRDFLRITGALGLLAGMEALVPAYARSQGLGKLARPGARELGGSTRRYDLGIGRTAFEVGGRRASAIGINGTVPGPLLRFREGEEALLPVNNALSEDASIHWHGLIVPPEMDGVPGVSFNGIVPGGTYEYRFPVKQYGTYWYHSHSAFQEQLGVYGPIIIDPTGGYPFEFDREYVVMLSDWTFEDPERLLDRLKKAPEFYQYNRRTVVDFFRDAARNGLGSTIRERLEWQRMRMSPTDISDVTGATYTYLMNGLAPASNWTGLFRPGERVLLRFINAGAATYFDVRVPGLPMTVVQVDGQFVQQVETDEFRIASAETYDVIVQPGEDRAYTVFAETIDRSGYARGTLATSQGLSGPIPRRRKPPLLTMADMGMAHGDMAGMAGGDMAGMNHGDTSGTDHGSMSGMGAPAPGSTTSAAAAAQGHAGHDMSGISGGRASDTGLAPPGSIPAMVTHSSDTHGPQNAAVPMMTQSRLHEPGVGLGEDGWRVLVYSDLRALHPEPRRAPDREIELHLTGNMERYMWSIDGKRFDEAEPIRFNYGERIRLTLVNDTMMNHPMHLHGMWMELENGHGEYIPRVHTINVKPAERLSLLVTADAPGAWAFHCHILYHMDVGMFRVVEVSQPTGQEVTP